MKLFSGFTELSIVDEWIRYDLLDFYREKLKETDLEIERIKKTLETIILL